MQTCMDSMGKRPIRRKTVAKASLQLALIVLLAGVTARATSPTLSANQQAVHVPLDQVAPMRIDSAEYERMTQALVLSDAQRKRADQLYAAYRNGLDELHQEARQQSQDALREVMAHAEAEGDFDLESFGQERAARVLQSGHRVIKQSRSRANELLLHFEKEVRGILIDEQQERWAPVRRAIRRDRLLGRRLPPNTGYDFFRHADLIELYSAAVNDSGEFALLYDSGATPDDEAKRLEAVRKIQDLLHHYEVQLDSLLESGLHAQREVLMQMELAAMRGRTEQVRTHHRRLINSWRQVHQLTQNSAEAIGRLAAPVVGEPARLRWMSRFWRETCPDLLAPDSAELMFDWALDLDELEEENRQRIVLLRDQYEQRRYALWTAAARTRIEIFETQHMLLGNKETILIEGHTPVALRENEEQRAALAREAASQLREALPVEQRQLFDERLRRLVGGTHMDRLIRY